MEDPDDKHARTVDQIRRQVLEWREGDRKLKLRFKHGSTNSTRSIEGEYQYIDVSSLNSVLKIDREEMWALVEPNVPMDRLIDETLKEGLVPQVVMEFPGITVGGGIQGAALESSSFKYGQFNDTCLEYELVTADGAVIAASSDANADIFYGISGSYGTIALLTMAKIRLVPAERYVELTYVPLGSSGAAVDRLQEEIKKDPDFLEGMIFSPSSAIVIIGRACDIPEGPTQTFSRTSDLWFYEDAKKIALRGEMITKYIPLKEYLFRYDRGAFWMAEYVFPLLHIPRSRSMKRILDRYMHTRKLYEYLHAANITQRYFIQDFYYPFKEAGSYLRLNETEMKIYPVWLCPIKAASSPQKLSPSYSPGEKVLLNIGIYGRSKEFPGADPIARNREAEVFGNAKRARKMFYAHTYYPKEEFWKIYDYTWYRALRDKYFAQDAFPDIWEKIFVPRLYRPDLFRDLFKQALSELRRHF